MTLSKLLLLATLPLTAFASDLPNPVIIAQSAFERDGYLGAIKTLESIEGDYRGSNQWQMYVQHRSAYLSYVGDYQAAHRWFDEIRDRSASPTLALTDYITSNAAAEILLLARQHRAVFINEAHHVPQHRVLTGMLLQELYHAGYRYFAAETISPESVDALNDRGYPLRDSGFYSVEPLYGDLVRRALNIGYEVISYEDQTSCDYKKHADNCQDERERAQAQNLIDRILTKDPHAKMLVHAGYDHIYEASRAPNFPWKPMAAYFKERSGIDPLTVGQTEMHERSKQTKENADYHNAERYFAFRSPVVLKSKSSNAIWTDVPGYLDMQVFSPRSGRGIRPIWLANVPGRIEVKVDLAKTCGRAPRCLIQAFHKTESDADAVPVDQVLMNGPVYQVALFLPPGSYRFVGHPEK